MFYRGTLNPGEHQGQMQPLVIHGPTKETPYKVYTLFTFIARAVGIDITSQLT